MEHQRLFHLLRLCDYIIFSALHQMVNSTLRSLLLHLAPARNALAAAPGDAGSALPLAVEAETAQAANPATAADGGEGEGGKQAAGEEGEEEAAAEAAESRSGQAAGGVEQGEAAVFEVEVILEGDDLIFVPSPRDFEERMEALVEKYLESVNANRRLLGNDRLAEYTGLYEADTDVSGDALASVADNVLNDDEFKGLKEGLREALADAFDLAEMTRQSYEPFRIMAIENRKVNADDLKDKFAGGGMELEDFKASLVQFRAEMADVDKLPDWKDCGILRVDTQRLKGMLAPAPAEAKDKVEELLPRLADERQKGTVDHVKAANAKLDKKPASVAEFVALLAFVDEEMQVKEDLEGEMAYLVKHFAMMDEQKVPVPDNVRATFNFLKPEYERMQQSMEMLESKREEDIAAWNAKLDLEIKDFGNRIKEMRNKASNPLILQETDTPEIILEEASLLRQVVYSARIQAEVSL